MTNIDHYSRRALLKTHIVDVELLSKFNYRVFFDRLQWTMFVNLRGHIYTTLVHQFYANIEYNRLHNNNHHFCQKLSYPFLSY